MSYYFAIVGTQDNVLFETEFGTFRHGGDGVARFPAAAQTTTTSASAAASAPRPDGPALSELGKQMNQFVVHASLDVLEEEMWRSGNMFLRNIDRFHSSYVFAFLTGSGTKFLLLYNPTLSRRPGSASTSATAAASSLAAPAPASLPGSPALPQSSHAGAASAGLAPPGSQPVGNGSAAGAGTSAAAATAAAAAAAAAAAGQANAAAALSIDPHAAATEEPIRSFFMDVYDLWLKGTMNPFAAPNGPIRSEAFKKRVALASRRYL